MGMSASQARLLGLTARQSNLEFEGQQINQQRTNLSNQSANHYNSLLMLNVPTPPSTDDYTTVKYDFLIGGNEATIAKVLPQDDNQHYLVSYTTNLTAIGIQENSAYKITATSNSSSKKVGTSTTVAAGTTFNKDKEYYVQTFREDSTSGSFAAINNKSDGYDTARLNGATFYDKNGNQVPSTEALNGTDLKDDYTALVSPKNSDEKGYSMVNIKLSDKAAFEDALGANVIVTEFEENTAENGKTGTDELQVYSASNDKTFGTISSEYKEAFVNAGLNPNDYYQYEASNGTRFALRDDVEKSANNSTLTINTSAVASMNKKQTTELSGVQIEFDSTGRIATMTDADGNSYTMTASTETDDAAYEDAYNQYTYDQYLYDQVQNDINANIEILQAQDKNLELRLSQLNTEHSAIQTEIDAVSKVLNKNIETSFKTFNG